MKKLFVLLSVLVPAAVMAQELTDAQQAAMNAAQAISNTKVETPAAPKPNYWKNSVNFDLGLNQTWMTSWAAGGYPSVSLAAGVDGKALYERGRASWNNRAQLNYGFLWSADKANLIQSSNDRIYLESKFDYKMTEKSKWRYSAGFDFKTQFANARDNYRLIDPENVKSGWTGDLKSSIFSPAYINLALGLDWKPNNWFDMSIAPLTGGAVIVMVEELRDNYGMPMYKDSDKYRPIRWQLGTQIKANAKVNINDWFNYETQVVLFGNYLGQTLNKEMRTHDWFRVNWDNKISFDIAKYFKVGLQTWLIYDPSVIYQKKDAAGHIEEEKARPTQFKEFFSISFSYAIASKKK